MKINVKIIDVNENWASITYNKSSAKSRIKTERLAKDYEKGILNVLNSELLEPYLNLN
ncbi:hypothetical protein [Portibacter lacus]|uniref:Uncharacterized protein n=1 Tax=Portibacter lacus TaxID=1099794 RepID=A0AA37SM66_9BACT|nr:hypothetical protein [Portibacter lacus]GLR15937.1 hypothetical protein GCM10007940_05520 [Portibacter lacus]